MIEEEGNLNPRGKRLLYSRFFAGAIHKDDSRELMDFKRNCAEKGVHMSYNGGENRCGWSIALKQSNEIDKVLIPIAAASGVNTRVFIAEVMGEFLENMKAKSTKNDLAKRSVHN